MTESPEVTVARIDERVNGLLNQTEGIERAVSDQGTDIAGMRTDLSGFVAELREKANAESAARATLAADLERYKREHQEVADQKWRAHEKVEEDKWDGHERRHDADAHRLYAVIGFCMTGLVIITSVIVHFT